MPMSARPYRAVIARDEEAVAVQVGAVAMGEPCGAAAQLAGDRRHQRGAVLRFRTYESWWYLGLC